MPQNVFPGRPVRPIVPVGRAQRDTARILSLLRMGAGHDFLGYKPGPILRAVESRMAACAIDETDTYVGFLERHPEEIQVLFANLLIRMTSFFRDPQAFDTLQRKVLPQLLRNRPPGSVFQAWVPGCSSGEEAYSLALLLQEHAEATRQAGEFRIFATDIDKQALDVARTGLLDSRIAQDVPAGRLERFFAREQHGYRLSHAIRKMVAFRCEDVLSQTPSTMFDLISCRNLLIYLEPVLQDFLLASFHRVLRPGGVLFLSPSESIGGDLSLFSPISRRWKLYRANHLYRIAAAWPPAMAQEQSSKS